MSIKLNHTIIYSNDKRAAAEFLTEILGLLAPIPFGNFLTVQLDNEVTLDFMEGDGDFARQHYAFLVSEKEFDEIFGRIRQRELAFWADPHHHQSGKINRHDGGRGVYFSDPDGHNLEIITHPYGK